MSAKTFWEPLEAIEFAIILQKPKKEAADALRSILRNCEAVTEQIEVAQTRLFSVLVCAARVATERELFREDENPLTGFPFTNTDDWLAYHCPRSVQYAQKANKIQAGIPKASIPQLEAMTVGNADLLANYVSTESVRDDPEVIEAAATMPESKFRKMLNDRGQHIEKPRQVFKPFPESKAKEVEQAMAIVARKFAENGGPELSGMNDILWHLAVDIIAEHSEVPE